MAELDDKEWVAKYDPHMGWVVDGVCVMLTDYEGTPGEAHILAASKRMLAECRATATMLRASPIADHPWVVERIAALEAVVAKAEGEHS